MDATKSKAADFPVQLAGAGQSSGARSKDQEEMRLLEGVERRSSRSGLQSLASAASGSVSVEMTVAHRSPSPLAPATTGTVTFTPADAQALAAIRAQTPIVVAAEASSPPLAQLFIDAMDAQQVNDRILQVGERLQSVRSRLVQLRSELDILGRAPRSEANDERLDTIAQELSDLSGAQRSRRADLDALGMRGVELERAEEAGECCGTCAIQ